MKYNIKDCIVLILFIIIIYLLFTTNGHFTNGHFTNGHFTNESFTDGTITEDEKLIIKNKCDDITKNINIILKATKDSVNNKNNFLLQKDVTTFNNINTVNSNIDEIYVNSNARVNIKYDIDKTTNTYTPTTKIDIFPNYMIVAYNMIHQYNDMNKPTIIANYNLPPGWVKCDGQHWYVFTNSETNEITAVNAGFHGLLKEDGKIEPHGYEDSQHDVIQTLYQSNNVTSSTSFITHIITPDLRGRMVCGGGPQNKGDDIDKFIFTQDPPPTETPTTNSIGGQEYVKLDPSHISHRHLTHMAINGNSNAESKYFTEVSENNLKIVTTTTSNNFSRFSLKASIPRNSSGNPFVMTTSDFYINNGTPNYGVPRNNMPPFHTLVYIMKIATVVIPNS